jgi:hypothetical protein
MNSITLTIATDDKPTLRITASYLLALAGDITADVVVGETASRPVFTATEHAEAAELAESGAYPESPTPASVFGGPASAPSTVAVTPSPIAPVATPAITSPETPTVPVPPAPTPANAAPTAAPQTASPAPGVELDVRGLPWDARIHSRGKSKLANGQWKLARGIDPNLVTQVENELRAVMAVPTPTAAPATPAVPVPPPLAPAADAGAPQSIPVPPAPPATTAIPASPSSQPFPALMQKVAQAITGRQLNQAQVLAIVQGEGVGLPALPNLVQRPDLIPTVSMLIDAQIAANVASGQPV